MGEEGRNTAPIKGWDPTVLDLRLIVIVAVDECAGLARQLRAERLNQDDVSGLQGSCATYATFSHA
jgi:hypothetical protein